MRLVLMCVLMSTVFLGCSEDDDDSSVPRASGRCDIDTNPSAPSEGYSFCHMFRKWPTSTLTQAETDCEDPDELGGEGTWQEITAATDGCSEVGKLGECTWSATFEVKTTYTNVPDSTTAEEHCENTWDDGSWEAASE